MLTILNVLLPPTAEAPPDLFPRRRRLDSHAEPVVVYVGETDISPDVHAVEHFRVGLVLAIPAHLFSKGTTFHVPTSADCSLMYTNTSTCNTLQVTTSTSTLYLRQAAVPVNYCPHEI